MRDPLWVNLLVSKASIKAGLRFPPSGGSRDPFLVIILSNKLMSAFV